MDKTKLTRDEALRRWKASKETKRKWWRNWRIWFAIVVWNVLVKNRMG